MPRIAPRKQAALDILDRLFFNQTCVLSTSESLAEEEAKDTHAKYVVVLRKLQKRVAEEVAFSGATGVAAEALRHTVYCILEAQSDDDLISEQANYFADRLGLTDMDGIPLSTKSRAINPIVATRFYEYNREFFQAFIIAQAQRIHGVCGEKALKIAIKINKEEKITKLPAVVRYRLSERLFSLDFPLAPALFLSWMFRIEALKSKKFVLRKAKSEISSEFKARAGLLCDFILLRKFVNILMNQSGIDLAIIKSLFTKNLSDEAYKQLDEMASFTDSRIREMERSGNSYKTFDLNRIDDSVYLLVYLDCFAQNEIYCRFWSGRQHSWIGIVGSGLMHYYHNNEYKNYKITSNGNEYYKFDGLVAQNTKTVAEISSEKLSEYGLHCEPGSLYETYRKSYLQKPTGLHCRAARYISTLDEIGIAFPATVEDGIFLAMAAAKIKNPTEPKN